MKEITPIRHQTSTVSADRYSKKAFKEIKY
jgi:hypothetical protein